jgi:hypothetical protein
MTIGFQIYILYLKYAISYKVNNKNKRGAKGQKTTHSILRIHFKPDVAGDGLLHIGRWEEESEKFI